MVIKNIYLFNKQWIYSYNLTVKSPKIEKQIEFRRRKMPVLAETLPSATSKRTLAKAITHNGFVNGRETKRQKSGGADAVPGTDLWPGMALLAGSIEYTPGDGVVTVSPRPIRGCAWRRAASCKPTVTPQMRKFAWAQHITRKLETTEEDTLEAPGAYQEDQAHRPHPQRQFISKEPGPELAKIDNKLEQEIQKDNISVKEISNNSALFTLAYLYIMEQLFNDLQGRDCRQDEHSSLYR